MGMTMTQKILAKHAGLDEVKAGDLIICQMDWAMTNDLMGVQTFQEFEKIDKSEVFDKEKVIIIPDHFTPNNDIKSAELTKKLREFARKYEITNYFEIGRMGIEHAFLPEQGFVAPGEVIIGADSHTCTYGTLNAFSTGVGLTDLGASLVTGTTWLKVPSAIKVELVGNLPKYVKGKDVVLTLIGMIGVDGARYQSLEFAGNIGALSIDDRFTICNMAIEAGAKNGIFPVDEITTEYLKGRVQRDYEAVTPDADAEYERTIVIELDKLTPVVAYPHLPENIKPADQFKDINIDQVVIGSCTNGRISDLQQAAEILKGHKIHENVRMIVFPATQDIYMEAFEKGYMKIFVDAGAVVSTPMCGPCLGGHNGVLAAGERALATTNRNFRGRMGHVESEVYLSGPYVAAASAIMGRIAMPEEID